MHIDSDTPTHEMRRPVIRRYREVARDIRETALTAAAITWLLTGAVVFAGMTRIMWKLG